MRVTKIEIKSTFILIWKTTKKRILVRTVFIKGMQLERLALSKF